LAAAVPYLKGAERVQVAPNTLRCRIERDGPVLVSFFGGLGLGQAAPRDKVEIREFYVASLLDIAGTKVAVVQKRAEAKDYLDIDALIQNGIDLPTALAAGRVVYGRSFNPMITLKALSFFDDLPTLSAEVRQRLSAAADAVDPANLPALTGLLELEMWTSARAALTDPHRIAAGTSGSLKLCNYAACLMKSRKPLQPPSECGSHTLIGHLSYG
jgi:hypothetical protein